MESNYSVLTLKSGDHEIPFVTLDQFVDEVESKTGIFTIDQEFYSSGRKVNKSSLENLSTKTIQVVQKMQDSSRYFINTPSGKVKVFLLNASRKTVRDLLISFLAACKRLALNYPSNQYAFAYNDKVLDLASPMSEVPIESEVLLVNQGIYPELLPLGIVVSTLAGRRIPFDVNPYDTIELLKIKISENEGIPFDQQRLVFEGRQLENHRTIEDYNIQNGSRVNLILRLRGGGVAPSFSFNAMESAVKMEFSRTAPDWRTVEPGISWMGICNNSACKAFTHEVICNYGFGIFDVYRQKRITVCPICKQVVRNLGGCGFFNCNFSFYGVQENGETREGSGEASRENYTAFLNGEDIQWRYLKIQVEDSGISLY